MIERRHNDLIILNKLDKQNEEIEEIKLQMTRLLAHYESESGNITRLIANSEERITNIEKLIHGNGKLGLKGEIGDIKVKVTFLWICVIGSIAVIVKNFWDTYFK